MLGFIPVNLFYFMMHLLITGEYVENQCFNSSCEPCETRFPSCVGKVDGSNEFPGRENTEYYIVCYRERTVAIVSCTIGIYSHADRVCVGEVKNSTSSIAPARR
jgi:hypothetical protein